MQGISVDFLPQKEFMLVLKEASLLTSVFRLADDLGLFLYN